MYVDNNDIDIKESRFSNSDNSDFSENTNLNSTNDNEDTYTKIDKLISSKDYPNNN